MALTLTDPIEAPGRGKKTPMTPEQKKMANLKARILPAIKYELRMEHLDMRFSGKLDERYRLTYSSAANKGFGVPSTACWFYEKNPHPGAHYIVIGDDCLDNATKLAELEDSMKGSTHESLLYPYIRAYYRHEVAHSILTHKQLEPCGGLKSLKEELDRVSVPFRLWNLFEDARIEEWWRNEFGSSFEWTKFEEVKDPDMGNPSGIFFWMIQNEIGYIRGTSRKRVDELIAKHDFKASDGSVTNMHSDRILKVHGFYNKALKVTSRAEMVNLLVDWKRTFPDPPADGSGTGKGSMTPSGDMETALGLTPSSKDSVVILAEGTDSGSGLPGEEGMSGSGFCGDSNPDDSVDPFHDTRPYTITESKMVEDGGKLGFFELKHGRVANLDEDSVKHQLPRFMKIFRGSQERLKSQSFSKKFSVRQLMRGSPRVYIRKGEGRTLSPRKVVLIIDCSGSMSSGSGGRNRYSVFENGLTLISILNHLARAGKIEMTLLLSAGMGTARYLRVEMPIRDSMLTKLHANGGFEAFDNTMKQNEKELIEADYVFAYTDGNITDTHVDKAYWAKKGVFPIGCYVGAGNQADNLHTWFPTVICRSSIESLCDTLVQVVRSHSFKEGGVR